MVTQARVLLQTWLLLFFYVRLSQPVCVDVPSATEVVLGESMKLTCIACMKREEIKAKTSVDWFYTPMKETNVTSSPTQIYKYEGDRCFESDGPFKGRLRWNGSKDLQDLSLYLSNVTYNDSGHYKCQVERKFEFDFFTPSVTIVKNIKLLVKEKVNAAVSELSATSADVTAFYSEILMYVLLVFLTFWLLVEMVYCYRKISKSDEQNQDTAY